VNSGIKSGIKAVWKFIGPVISSISGLFRGIGVGLQWAWDNIIGPLFRAIMDGVRAVQSAIASLTGKGNGPGHEKGAPPRSSMRDYVQGHMRASGGPVTAGMPYIVGERHAELFVPNSNGRIVPQVPTSTSSRGDVNIVVNINGVTDKHGVAMEIRQTLLGLKRTLRGDLGLA